MNIEHWMNIAMHQGIYQGTKVILNFTAWAGMTDSDNMYMDKFKVDRHVRVFFFAQVFSLMVLHERVRLSGLGHSIIWQLRVEIKMSDS